MQREAFPPRKRSIPYGFDFDLDEVWANRSLQGLRSRGSASAASGQSTWANTAPIKSTVTTAKMTPSDEMLRNINSLTRKLDAMTAATATQQSQNRTKPIDKK